MFKNLLWVVPQQNQLLESQCIEICCQGKKDTAVQIVLDILSSNTTPNIWYLLWKVWESVLRSVPRDLHEELPPGWCL